MGYRTRLDEGDCLTIRLTIIEFGKPGDRVGPFCATNPTITALAIMFKYQSSKETVIYLINETVNGSAARRLAAAFILHCMRTYPTREEIEHCIGNLEERAILDVAGDVRQMALNLRLIG